MSGIIATSAGHAAMQARFVQEFGAFLTDEAKIGLKPYGFSDDGEILYGPMEKEADPLEPIFLIDGSPRKERVGGVDIPELKDARGHEYRDIPFASDVFALQKAIEVPLAPLMTGISDDEKNASAKNIELSRRVAMYGHMSAREFLAEHYGRAGDEKERIIKPVAEDIDAVAQRHKAGEGNYMPNVYFFNSAILFAALGDSASSERAVNNFFEAARSLYVQKYFVAAAAVAEKALEMSQRDFAEPLGSDGSDVLRTMIADSWHCSLEANPGGATFLLRLYRGMRSAANIKDKAFMGKFLRLASHANLAQADFEKASSNFMRRAWYGAQRYPMDDTRWFIVQDMINRAVVYWISRGVEESVVERAVGFAQRAERIETGLKVGSLF